MADKAKAVKAKRTMLTPAEKIAKAEADLAQLRVAAAEKDAKRRIHLESEKSTLIGRVTVLTDKIADIDSELAGLTPPVVEEISAAEDAADE